MELQQLQADTEAIAVLQGDGLGQAHVDAVEAVQVLDADGAVFFDHEARVVRRDEGILFEEALVAPHDVLAVLEVNAVSL